MYKICTRCYFRVAVSKRLCHICGCAKLENLPEESFEEKSQGDFFLDVAAAAKETITREVAANAPRARQVMLRLLARMRLTLRHAARNLSEFTWPKAEVRSFVELNSEVVPPTREITSISQLRRNRTVQAQGPEQDVSHWIVDSEVNRPRSRRRHR